MAHKAKDVHTKKKTAIARELAAYLKSQGLGWQAIADQLKEDLGYTISHMGVKYWFKEEREVKTAKPRKSSKGLKAIAAPPGQQKKDEPPEVQVEDALPWDVRRVDRPDPMQDIQEARDVAYRSMKWHEAWAEVVDGNDNKSDAWLRATHSGHSLLKLCMQQIELDQFKGIRVRKGGK